MKMSMWHRVQALSVRVVLILHAALVDWQVVVRTGDDAYWMLALALVPLVLETIYNVVKRAGIEWRV